MTRWVLGAWALGLAAVPRSAEACAACFGRSDSPMAQGMNMGIFSLLLIIVSVLLSIAAFFVYILRRAARLARDQAGPAEFRAAQAPLASPTTQ